MEYVDLHVTRQVKCAKKDQINSLVYNYFHVQEHKKDMTKDKTASKCNPLIVYFIYGLQDKG